MVFIRIKLVSLLSKYSKFFIVTVLDIFVCKDSLSYSFTIKSKQDIILSLEIA
jgi:hypothetical protein